ncbi:MAG: DeoR/GlpR family DNA-binding transcription regulator [Parvibaculaceae bacterium]
MRPAERRQKILELVNQSARVTVDDLSESLKTSRETVRRDLSLLSDQGLLRKVHGGAKAAQPAAQSAQESPLGERRGSARLEKIRIGRRAARLFNAGDSLLINCGTTTIFFAEELARHGPFTVITNGSMVAQELWAAQQRGPIHLLGGAYFGDAFETVGPQVVEQIQKIHADHAVLTIGSISGSARIMDYNVDEAYVSRAMIEAARSVTVLADASKLNRNALIQICGPERIDRLVTDKAPEPALASLLTLAGVDIIVAEAE